jgi:hypothetical protein
VTTATRDVSSLAMRIVIASTCALALAACKSDDKPRAAIDRGPAAAAPAPTAAIDPGTGMAAGATAASCVPAAPHQRPGKATITIAGDGIDQAMTAGPAVCGALHTVATKRFAVGDGTLYRACLPDGSSFAISSDVALTGHVDPTFKYENYKKTGPLLEYTRPDVGTYNQRDPVGEGDKLFIEYDGSAATTTVVLQWPSKPDRQLTVTATVTCDPPTP